MLGGANTDLLREIRAITCWLPELEVNWIKVKAHRKRNTKSFHKVINDEMDTLSNTVHTGQGWKAWNTAQHFANSLTELNIGTTRITGHAGAGKALQQSFTVDKLVGKLR